MELEAVWDLPVPAIYGRHLMRLFDAEKLLARTGLVSADLEDPGRRVTVRQVLQYAENAIALSPRPEWHFEWALSLSDHFHGPISVALMSAPTLGASLDAFLKYFPGRAPYLDTQGRREGDRFRADLRPLIDPGVTRPLILEMPLLILQRYLVSVYGVAMGEAQIELDYPATEYADVYARYFGCPIHFDAPCAALIIPASWRDMPNLGYSPSTWAHALEQCEATLGSSRDRDTLGQVRHYLSAAIAHENRLRALPTLRDTAAALHLAPRTLIRRLRAMGTTYQEVIDDFLQERTRELLVNHHLQITEVAAALGFSNPANFGKAFKRWFGVSPGSYRAGKRRLVRG